MIKVMDWVLVHGFALLHAAVVVACYFIGIPDALILTLLTMTMVVLLCLKKNLSVEFTAVTIILANIIGFFLGTLLAKLFHLFLAEDFIVHSIATFLTTEGIGWLLIMSINKLNPKRAKEEAAWKENLGWLIAAVTIVFMIRLAINLIFSWESTTVQAITEASAFCLVFLVFFYLYMRNQAQMKAMEEQLLEAREATALQAASAAQAPFKEKFIVHLNNRIVPVAVKDIAYIFAEDKSSYIVTRAGLKHPLDDSLDAIEAQLDPKRFFRISRSCIISSDAISSVSKVSSSRLDVTLTDGLQAFTDLTVSRARVAAFLEWFEK